jgi:hypothetical protein
MAFGKLGRKTPSANKKCGNDEKQVLIGQRILGSSL